MIDPSLRPSTGAAGKKDLSSGGPVVVRALRKGDDGRWLVEYGGREILVKTTRALVSGGLYRGILGRDGKFTEFAPVKTAKRPQAGLPADGRSPLPAGGSEGVRLTVAAAMMRASLPPPTAERMEKLSRLSRGSSPGETLKRAGFAARCESRGLDFPDEEFEKLYALLDGSFEGSDGDSGGKPGRERRKDSETIRIFEEEAEEDASTLSLFNHTAEGAKSWIIIPYSCTIDESVYSGSLRMCYNTAEKKTEAAVLSVKSADPDDIWYFRWNTEGRGRLRAYAGVSGTRTTGLSEAFARKFRKHGLIVDDIVYSDDIFDGFEESGGQLNLVNETV